MGLRQAPAGPYEHEPSIMNDTDPRYPLGEDDTQALIEACRPDSHTFLNACARLSRETIQAMAQAYLREMRRDRAGRQPPAQDTASQEG